MKKDKTNKEDKPAYGCDGKLWKKDADGYFVRVECNKQ